MKKYADFDIMIDNIEKAWRSRMSDNNSILESKWEIPQYSKSQINKAGKTISAPDTTDMGEQEALNILNNWRSAHAYPLQVIAGNLRRNNKNAIVVQRLKRLESITGKLKRFPEMSLYRMQDLGGCRVIVDSIEEVYSTIDKYKNSRIRHILKREDDYIQIPKNSGYRSYHIVYQFQSDQKDTYNRNMLIEIQFRTKLQHTWATAVEMMGIYTKSALKASVGDTETLRFFILVSSVFAKMEKTSLVQNTKDSYDDLIGEIKEIDRRLNIVSRISALSVAINHVNKQNTKKKNGYYILRLNYKEKTLKIHQYSTNQIELATKIYNQIEAFNSPDIDTVLVSASSFDTLKAAYPNYFTDITEFVTMMRRILA